MWKGLKKVLGKPGKSKKCSLEPYALDTSTRSTSSAGPSSVVFPLDLADTDGVSTWQEQQQHNEQQFQQLPRIGVKAAAGPDPLTASQVQQQLQQQLVLQKLVQRADDHSVHKRQAAALQKRIDNQMLDPTTCLYQISSLLSMSTLFEHKLLRDTAAALRQVPGALVTNAAAAAAAANEKQEQGDCTGSQQHHWGCSSASSSDNGSCCASVVRTPSATAASTAHVALQLVRLGYRVIVRKVLHSKAYWTKSMDNTFIVALDTSSGNHVEYIVDPHFRETFNVGVMSDNYSAVWHSLPQVFIGMPCQLQPVVQLLCEEVELSFLEAGRPCPPWREWAATINRWMSDQYVDILVPEPGAPDEEVVEFITRCCQFSNIAAAANGVSGASTTSSGAASTCSPVNLHQQRLQDKMHVSSVLSSVSTNSKRQVPEPLHKQFGFDAVMEDDPQQLLPTTLRDASFTSVTSDASAESVQMLTEAQAAAKAAEAAKRPQVSVARSLSIPSAEILSSSASSAASGECLVEDFALTVTSAAKPPLQQQQEQQQTSIRTAAVEKIESSSARLAGSQQQQQGQQHDGCTVAQPNISSSAPSASCTAAQCQVVTGQQPKKLRSKSLLTAHMQLKAQLQQQQQQVLMPSAGTSLLLHEHVQLQQQLRSASLQQQQQVQPQQLQQAQQLQHQQLLQQLQLQHQQMLQQHMAMQQIQQQNILYPQQLAILQQQCAQPDQKAALQALQQQQQQQQVAPLLPVVHTVRPCGQTPTAAPAGTAAAMVNHAALQQLQQQQQVVRQPLSDVAQLYAMQAPLQQQQPRLLRLIHRNK